MAAKIDKEFLIKWHFWILAGLFVILALVPLLMLTTSVSATVADEQEKLNKNKEMVKGIKDPKNQSWVDALTKQDGFVEEKKNDVWAKAWELQKDLMTWPQEFVEKYAKDMPEKYFGDNIDTYVADKFRGTYSSQLKEVYDLVQPVDHKGDGVVQFKAGEPEALLGLQKDFRPDMPLTKEDIWLVQENLWVKRELLRVVRAANDSIAWFNEVPPPAAAKNDKATKPGATPSVKKTYRNPTWELELTLAQGDKGQNVLRGRIKNLTNRRQPLGIAFRVYLQGNQGKDGAAVALPVDRLPLPAGESAEIKELPIPSNLPVETLAGVEEILNWRTAPVKRIDDLRMDYPSSRTAGKQLKPPLWYQEPVKEGAGADAAGGGQGGPPSDMAKFMGAMMGGRGGMGGASSAPAGTTLNGLNLYRYTDRNPQVRHMPVAMVLVCQEENIPDVLAAFENSTLRIQVLQYHWNHFRDKIKPPIAEEQQPGQVASARGRGPAFPGMGEGDAMTGGGGGRRGGVGGKFGGQGGGMEDAMGGGRRGQGGGFRGPGAGAPGLGGGGARFPGMGEGPGMAGGMMSQMQQRFGRGGRPGFGGFAMGPGTMHFSSASAEDEEEDMNLVELAVYGLASLYEKFPPKPATPETPAGGTPAATTPAAGK
jgi:hypothetical protein